jgi:hypothetical protein
MRITWCRGIKKSVLPLFPFLATDVGAWRNIVRRRGWVDAARPSANRVDVAAIRVQVETRRKEAEIIRKLALQIIVALRTCKRAANAHTRKAFGFRRNKWTGDQSGRR